jgi:GNAT superfamily N-acetyltransferase
MAAPLTVRSPRLGLRVAEPWEWPAALALTHRAVMTSNAVDYALGARRTVLADYHPAALERALARGLGLFALADQVPIGVGIGLRDKIFALFVDPDWQGMGLGRLLLDGLVAEARERGISYLRVHASLTAADFYAANGFEDLDFGPQPARHTVPTRTMALRLV